VLRKHWDWIDLRSQGRSWFHASQYPTVRAVAEDETEHEGWATAVSAPQKSSVVPPKSSQSASDRGFIREQFDVDLQKPYSLQQTCSGQSVVEAYSGPVVIVSFP
jgi:hypothetical protein